MLMCSNITVYQRLCIRCPIKYSPGIVQTCDLLIGSIACDTSANDRSCLSRWMAEPVQMPNQSNATSSAIAQVRQVSRRLQKEATPRMTWKLEQPWYWSHWSFNFAGNESLLSHTSTGCNCETTSFLINQCLGIRITSAQVRSTYFSMHLSRKCALQLAT